MLRNKFFDEIINKYNFFNDLDVKSKILFLFNNIDPFICKPVAAFWDYELQTRSCNFKDD